MSNFTNNLANEWGDSQSIQIINSWKNLFNDEKFKNKKIIAIDGDYSTNWDNLKIKLQTSISKNKKIIFLDFYRCLRSNRELNIFFNSHLQNDDPLFGKVSKSNINKLLNSKKILLFIEKFKTILKKKFKYYYIILLGTGVNSININNLFDSRIYLSLNKSNSLKNSNWSTTGKTQTVSPNFYYYLIFPILEKYQEKILSKIDYYVDNNKERKIIIITKKNLFKILNKISSEPLKLYPIYEPGVWGGKWLVKKRRLNIKNCAIGMELIAQEQNVIINFKNNLIEIPFPLIMSFYGKNILGKNLSIKYNNYLPVRVAYDDTYKNINKNLSIQVHPNKTYMKKFFNEPLGQAEMYYIADQSQKSKVYLGFKKKISKKDFINKTQKSSKTGIKINYEKYINSINASIGDLFLIPPGTIHAAGSNNFVLEISNTPYRYTFKIYDYCRLNLDGKKRQLSLDHAYKVLKYDRDSNWVNKNLIPKPKLYKTKKNYNEYLLSDHKNFTFKLFRIHFKNSYEDTTIKSMHILNIVKGKSIFLISLNNIKIKLSLSETLLIPKKFGKYKIISENNDELEIIKIVLKNDK